MKRLVLIRHGQAVAYVDQMVLGHGCTGLTAFGRRQAEALRDRLSHSGELDDASAIYASLMRRAAETAEILAPAIGGGGLELRAECGVCELHGGEGEGITWSEWERRYGAADVADERTRARAPGAESIDEFIERVGDTLERLTVEHEGDTVVVACHGGVVASALEVLVGMPYGSVSRYVENTGITEFERGEDGEWWLVRFNDAAHLANVDGGRTTRPGNAGTQP